LNGLSDSLEVQETIRSTIDSVLFRLGLNTVLGSGSQGVFQALVDLLQVLSMATDLTRVGGTCTLMDSIGRVPYLSGR
jgi:hypothetical protein